MSLETVFSKGNLVDINVSVWTAQRKLQKEDLGIEDESVSEAFILGRKNLVPAEVISEFRYLDYKARRVLYQHSFEFSFGGARFVPKKAFMDFVKEIDEVIKKFDEKADEFATNYEKYRLEMRQHYVQAAKDAYRRKSTLCGGFDTTEDEFLKNFLTRVEEFYPPVEKIRSRFHMDYSVFQASLPDLSQGSYEDFVEENEKLHMMQEAYRISLKKKVDSFAEKVVNDLREEASTILNRLKNSIKKGVPITDPMLNAVKNMITRYEQMNVMGDSDFEEQLKNFKHNILDKFTAIDLRESESMRRALYDDLAILSESACDQAAIEALIKRYKDRADS